MNMPHNIPEERYAAHIHAGSRLAPVSSETVVNQIQDSVQIGRIHLSGGGSLADSAECAGASEDFSAQAADHGILP